MLNWLGKLLSGTPSGAAPAAEPAALVRDALEHQRHGRFDQAERLLYRALALAPAAAEIQLLLGDLFRVQGKREASLQCCLAAVELAPGLAQAHNNLGTACRELGDFERAVAEYRRALVLDGSLPEAHFNLGVCLHQRGADEEAIRCYEQALRLKPDFALARLNLGVLLEDRADVAGAAAAYAGAVAADPGLVEAHVNHGMQLLLAGCLAEGWEEFEWRLRYPEYSGADVAAAASRWDGGTLDGRAILLEAEQGFGDALQFLRYAPLVAARGGRVIVRCAAELADLFAHAPGVSAVVRRGEALPSFDAWCPLPSLPRAFGTRLESVPAEVPYVRANPSKSALWRARLADAGSECRVGLVWASQSGHRTAAAKSIALEALAPLGGVTGVRFYSLQKGEAALQAQRPPAGMRLTDLGAELADFSDTAAAVANLDLVISVDTAVAHLAGAMARPTWTLLKRVPDWRWLLGRDDCPWYPTMRLYRQERPGDWQAPVMALAGELRDFVAARPPALR
jgi:tetratricopeptide (TPR) repeat protein